MERKRYDLELETIKACIDVNYKQKLHLFNKVKKYFGSRKLKGLNIAILGCTFKKGTDDLREAPSIENVKALLE